VLERLAAYRAEGDTVLIAGDFNAQPDYARLDPWYADTLVEPGNRGNTGVYRELDDTDPRGCAGYGEWTATGPPGRTPPCARPAAECSSTDQDGCAKIDMIFVPEDAIVGRYWADSLAIPTSCPAAAAVPGVVPPGACSDHRVLLGRVTVRVGEAVAAGRLPAAS
jgi:hypothetical protein